METATVKKTKVKNLLDRAKEEGCFHCDSAELASGKSEDGAKILTCKSCGCVHTEWSYEYAIPVASFERKVDVSKWNQSQN